MTTIHYSRVVHLSHVIDPRIPLWPGDPPPSLETVATIDRDGYALRRLSIGEHSATHANAPRGFDPAGAGIDDYSAESLVAPAIVVDIRARAAADPNYALSADDVLAWEAEHGLIPPASIVVLHTGWQTRWSDPQAFLGFDEAGGLHFPGFGAAVARFLLDERRIKGIGTDTHGVDPGQDTAYAANRQVLQQGGLVLENLANLDQLPPTGATLVVGILRLRGGTGSPAAVLGLIP